MHGLKSPHEHGEREDRGAVGPPLESMTSRVRDAQPRQIAGAMSILAVPRDAMVCLSAAYSAAFSWEAVRVAVSETSTGIYFGMAES